MIKICFVTAARSEYGLMKWIMKDVERTDGFRLQLVVTGAHLLQSQGNTVETIIDDGFNIDEKVYVNLDTSSKDRIAESMGKMAQAFARTFARLLPDYVVLLGDRYELLPIANTAFIMNIPIIHISGGDITEGAIDNGIRNAVTMLSSYHFPGVKESADNIIRMLGYNKHVWHVGEPGLDSFYRETTISRKELADDLRIGAEKNWVLFTYHAETTNTVEHDLNTVSNCIEVLLKSQDVQVVATYSNADYGGESINAYLETMAKRYPGIIRVIPSLGNRRYLSLMKNVCLVLGNSSSGITEAPMLGIPVVNVGNRQKGRHQCGNIIQAEADKDLISNAISKAFSMGHISPDYYWGDGHSSERIVDILRRELM